MKPKSLFAQPSDEEDKNWNNAQYHKFDPSWSFIYNIQLKGLGLSPFNLIFIGLLISYPLEYAWEKLFISFLIFEELMIAIFEYEGIFLLGR